MHKTAQFDAVNSAISLAAVHDRMVVFAQDEQGHLIHIDSVRRGKACSCRCLACNETLIARHGEIKAHSFAHVSGTECKYAIDAMLNRLASELVAARGCFSTPKLTVRASRVGPLGVIEHEETIPSRHLRVESVSIDRVVYRQRPRVVMLVKGRELILEMTHTRRLDADKRAAIETLGLPTIELRLADCKFETVEQFEHVLVDDTRHKHWIFNPKKIEIQIRLDGIVQEELDKQSMRHARKVEQQRQEQAALAAARLARKQEEQAELEERLRLQAQQDHLMRHEQARRDCIASAASQKPLEAHRQTLYFHMQDGGLMIRHEQGRQVLILPETGNEQALGMLAKLGLTYNPQRGGYPTTSADLPNILPSLMSFVKSVRSV
jgi:hypothetical protein